RHPRWTPPRRFALRLTRPPGRSRVPRRARGGRTRYGTPRRARMAAWRTLGSVVVVLAVARLAAAQTYPLAEPVQAGECCKLHLEMTLTGELKVTRDGKAVPLKLTATAGHDFAERVLDVGKAGLAEKTARVYDKAHAAIGVGDDQSE